MRIGITGCAGRMGLMLVRAVLDTPGAELSGGTERTGHEAVGRDLLALVGREGREVPVGCDPAQLFAAADCIIDFTVPAATLLHATLAAQASAALVVGTTGLGAEHRAALEAASARVPVVVAANMSIGVTLLQALVRQVAATLDGSYDIEIVEMHHRHKADAPSGTALALGAAAAAGRGVAFDGVCVRARDGMTGPRQPGSIGFATLRGGDVVGDHAVIFAGEGERIELVHKASSRTVFASGAVRAALWTQGRTAGLYSMRDVLSVGTAG